MEPKYTTDENLPTVMISDGTEKSIPPKGPPSFYFVIKDTKNRKRSRYEDLTDGGTVKRRFRVQKRQKQTMRPCNIRRRQRRTHAICRRRRNKNKTH